MSGNGQTWHELESIINRSPAVVFRWRVSESFPVEFVTENVGQWGYAPSDFTSGRVSWESVTHPDDLLRLRQEVSEHLNAGRKEFSQQYRLRTRWGEFRWVEDHNAVLFDARGVITHIEGVVFDVTDRHLAEEAYRTLADQALQGLVIIQGGRIVFANPAFAALTGYAQSDLLALTDEAARNLIHPDDRAAYWRAFRERLRGTLPAGRHEWRLVSRDGRTRWIEAFSTSVTFHGRPALQSACVDISAQKEAEARLHEAYAALERRAGELADSNSRLREEILKREQIEAALRASEADLNRAQRIANVGSWHYDQAGNRLTLSDQALRIFHLDPAMFRGDPGMVRALTHPGDWPRVREAGRLARAGLAPPRTEYRILWPDGSVRHVFAWGELLRDGDGRVTGSVGVIQDITERRRLEREILEISNREKRDIGQSVHDTLSQQLAGIMFAAKALEQDLARAGSDRADEVRRLGAMLSDALTQARSLAYGLSPVDMEEEGLAAALQRLAAGTSRLYGVPCRCVIRPPGRVADHDVATNLYHIAQEAVTNAVRHGGARHITITLTAGKTRGRLAVRDDGRGFAEEADSRGGLGLRIMRQRAAMVGGEVRFEAAPRGGTTVICTFISRPPAARARRAPTASRTSAPSGRGSRGSRRG